MCVCGLKISTATFDVQAVSVSVGPGSVTITCTFAEGSVANGCHAILRAENMTDVAMNISREVQSGGQQSQTAVDQAAGLEIGIYAVSVFDLENDNTVDLQNPIQIVEVNVTEPPSPPTPSSVLTMCTCTLVAVFCHIHNDLIAIVYLYS